MRRGSEDQQMRRGSDAGWGLYFIHGDHVLDTVAPLQTYPNLEDQQMRRGSEDQQMRRGSDAGWALYFIHGDHVLDTVAPLQKYPDPDDQ